MNKEKDKIPTCEVFVLEDEKSQKKKFNFLKISCFFFTILAVLIGSVLFVKQFLQSSSTSSEKRNILRLLDVQFEEKLFGMKNGYYILESDTNKYGFLSFDGKVQTEFKYGSVEVFGNLFVVGVEDKKEVLNEKLEIVFDLEDVITIEESNYAIGYKEDGGAFVFNSLGKIIIDRYDSLRYQDGFIVGSRGDLYDVFDSDLNVVLKSVNIVLHEADDMYDFELNKNFILLKNQHSYSVYYTTTGKTEEYSYAVLDRDYIAAKSDTSIILKNKRGELVNTFQNIKGSYGVVTKDILAVLDNEVCEGQNGNLVLYDNNSSQLKKCVSIYKNNFNGEFGESVIVRESDDKYTVYKNDMQIFSYDGTKDYTLYENDFGNYIYYSSLDINSNRLLDKNGEEILGKCNGVLQLGEDIFSCIPTLNVNYLYLEGKQILTDAYITAYSYGEFIVVKNIQGKYGLYDKYGNLILDEKYDDVFVNGDILTITLDGKYHFMTLESVDAKDYEEFLKKDNNIYSTKNKEVKDDVIEDVEETIKKYDLYDDKKLIYDNFDLFRRFAFHVLNNGTLSAADIKYLLSMFEAVVDLSKSADVNELFVKIDELKIDVYDAKPDVMSPNAVGEYFDLNTNIKVLKSHYDYALKHELMHMFSESLKQSLDRNAYVCTERIYSIFDVFKMSFEEQSICQSKYLKENMLLEEAGAEYFTRVVYDKERYQTYFKNIAVYVALMYVLDDDFISLQYSSFRELEFIEMVNKKSECDFNKISELLDAMNAINDINEGTNTKDKESYSLYNMAGELIDLYNSVMRKNWKDDTFFKTIIYYLVGDANINLARDYATRENITIKREDEFYDITVNSLNMSLTDYIFCDIKDYVIPYFIRDKKGNRVIIYKVDSGTRLESYFELLFDESGNVINTRTSLE